MSQPRQRLLPIARLPLALVGFLRATRASVAKRLRPLLRQIQESLALFLRKIQDRLPGHMAMPHLNEPVQGALIKISEGSKAIMALPAKSRALVELMPQPVQLELKKLSTRGAHVCRDV